MLKILNIYIFFYLLQVVRCGHTYCTECLVLIIHHRLNCPSCDHKVAIVSVDQSPINFLIYDMLPRGSQGSLPTTGRDANVFGKPAPNDDGTRKSRKKKSKAGRRDFCGLHNYCRLKYWCGACSRWVCSVCLRQGYQDTKEQGKESGKIGDGGSGSNSSVTGDTEDCDSLSSVSALSEQIAEIQASIIL